MKEKELLKKLMAQNEITQTELARRVGYKRIENISGILNRYASMRVDILVKLLNAMGYRLMVVTRTGKEVGEITTEEVEERKLIDIDEE